MPIAGKGMLLTSMDIDAADEAEFNRWYDREHLEERVAIDGFLEARRYVAHDGNPKYLSLYSTETFEVLDSPAYRSALANQTAWSKANIARFQNMIRGVAHITVSRGTGRGAALGIIRLRPSAGGEHKLRVALRDALDPSHLDGWRTTRRCRDPSPTILRRPIPAPALVRADRRHRGECGPGGRDAVQRQRSAKAAFGLERRLPADVGPREERSSP